MSEVADGPRRRVTLDEVRAHRDEIMEIAKRRKVRAVRIFGSVARGESDDDSDLDLLLDMDPEGSLFDMSGFALDVEELLNVFTQVATPNGLKSRIRDRVLGEAISL